jgi:hypothetical protein
MRSSLIILLLALMSLSACGPVYKTEKFYEPPQDEAGRACVVGCEERRALCSADCDARYDTCVYHAEMQARHNYLEAKERYLNLKERCLLRPTKDQDRSECQNLYEPNPNAYLNTSHCDKDCNCERDFDRCFQVCGGILRQQTRCVSGCDYR